MDLNGVLIALLQINRGSVSVVQYPWFSIRGLVSVV
jgi:hypothetical protein